ncbi:MAG TPA: glycoside hydrolase family 2 TIM barrel-domain containing protein [Myxococcaceae bacterium]|nr:glycoside hydrolase family 2 TIM barrel-domain containing protein [Myxococcaceae bacterium]
MNLNGRWDFALDPEGRWQVPGQVSWNKTIVVPFAPETTRSGIGDTGFYRACWYRRSFERPEHSPGERLILHFGAVDYAASVWVNGARCVHHEGGYTPFKVDITDLLTPTGVQEVVVLAEDDPADLAQPRGKQDWQLEPHSIWYPRTTGIWQTVWLERAPAVRVEALRWTPNLAGWEIGLEADILDGDRTDLQLAVRLTAGSTVLADDVYSVVGGEVFRRIALSDPGIDDFRNELLWAPHSPTLIGAEVELRDSKGQLIDEVKSYTALRSISAQGDRFVLNGRPYPMRLVLDQGYWPDTGITAPDDASLRLDVELARNMGFNGVRKHQKIEDPRYLYWADKLGLLVWEEMPSAYRFTRGSVQRLVREWTEVIDRDYSHPCIVAWVPFNESWGVPNLPNSASERHYVQSLFHLTKTLDPMRLVVGNDGWESVATDLIGIHDYEGDPEQLALRYHSEESRPQLFRRERPGGRVIVFDDRGHADHPIILSEFGGIAVSADHPEQWGYSRCRDTQELAQRYKALLEVVRKLSIFTGFCYTQFADTYQEANGLLYADRTPKFPLDEIAAATRGKRFFSDISMPPAPRRKPLPPPSTPDTEG